MAQTSAPRLHTELITACALLPGQVGGILAMPFITLTLEKTFYDSLCALRGIDIYTEPAANTSPCGTLPVVDDPARPTVATGSSLPSFSLMAMRQEHDRYIIALLGDPPRKVRR